MALLRRLFYRKPPDRLLEISDRVFVFDYCFSKDVLREDEFKDYLSSTVTQLQDHFPDASFMVFNFGEGERRSQISDILSHHDMTVMDYPWQYEGCPLLALEMIHHFLRSSESWLSLEGQQNVLLMHCDRGGWPVLAFMLAGLLLHRKQYSGEQKTLDMVYKQAPRELLHLLSPLNPQPSQLRYLQYITRRDRHSDWPPQCSPVILQSLIIRVLPLFHGETGLRPVVRVCGQNPSAADRNSKLTISAPQSKTHAHHYRQAEHTPVKIDIHVPVQGDVVLECIHLDEDMLHEEIIFRIMFNTAFIQSNVLMLNREEIDVVWGAKERFPKDFKAEVLFLDFNAVKSNITGESVSGGNEETDGAEEEFFEVEELFSNVDVHGGKGDSDFYILQGSIPDGGNHIWETRGISCLSKVQDGKLDDVNDKCDSLLHSVHGRQVEENYRQDGNVDSDFLTLHCSTMDDQKHRMRAKEVISDAHRKFEGKSVTNWCRQLESSDIKQDTGISACQKNLGCKDEQQKRGTEVKPQFSGSLPAKSPAATVHNIKQQDSDGSHKKMAETKTVSRREPPNNQSLTNTMQSLSHQPKRYSSQPASGAIVSVPPDHSTGETLKSTRITSNHISYEITDCPGDVLRPLPTLSTLSLPTLERSTPDTPCRIQGRCPLLSTSLQVNPPPLLPPLVVRQPLKFVQSPQLHSPLSPTKRTLQAPPPPPPPPPRPRPPPPPPPRSGRLSRPPSLPREENIQSTAPKIPLPPPLMTAISSNCPKLASTPPTLPKHGPPPPPTPPLPPPPPPKNGTPPPPPPPACGKTPPPPPPPPPRARTPGLPTESRTLGGAIPPPPPLGTKVTNKIGSNVAPRHSGGRGVSHPASLGHQGSLASANRRLSLKPLHWIKVTRAMRGSLWDELQRYGEHQSVSEFDVSELETLFSSALPNSADICSGGKSGGRRKSVGSKPEKIHLIDLRRSKNCEIMLTKVKMPFSDMMASVLALDESILDIDQVENLVKNCPTKAEMELLKGYNGNEEDLGKCEQFFLEMMKVPRVESKLRVFSFKIQFGSQISDFRKSLNTVNTTCDEVRNSIKLKEIMKKILCLGNTLNQGTARGSAVGFRLDSLLKLTDTRASNNKMTLMHFLCKVLATKSPGLLNFDEDLVSLEAASKIQLKSLAEEMQVILRGLEKVKQELVASENDGPVSGVFRKTLKEFVIIAEAEVASLVSLYSGVGRNADSLSLYFGEDPARCPFEQVTSTLLNFVRMFRRAHEENCKQAEMERRKAQKEGEMQKAKGLNQTKNIVK